MGSPREGHAPSRFRAWWEALRPQRPRTAYERGVAALEGGRHEEALTAFSEALGSAGENRAAIYNKRGVTYIALGKRDDALADFRAALENDRTFAPVHVNLGNLSLEAGDIDEAIEHYERALGADDRSAAAHRHLGIAYKRLGRHADAVRHLRSAMRLEFKVPWRRR